MRNGVVSFSLLIGLVLLAPQVADGQTDRTLRAKISQLFIFGAGDEPLVLGGSLDPSNPANVQAHGNHFVPSAVAGNATPRSVVTGLFVWIEMPRFPCSRCPR